MKKFIYLLLFTSLFGLDLSMTQTPTESSTDTNITVENSKERVFGDNLFLGKFANIRQYKYNANYMINIGDTITNKFWGAYDREIKTVVDSQGNIFIPQVGIIHLLGVKAGDLNKIVKSAVKKVFKSNVFVYSNVVNYQPITVFVAGSLKKPGLYEGLSSDNIIQYLDKAKGINEKDGSFRYIYIKRDGKILKEVDLYNFLVYGNLGLFQFKNGDVIFVDSLKNYVYVKGDVKRAYRFELKHPITTLEEIIKFSVPNKSVTNAIIYHHQNDRLITKKIALNNSKYIIYSGDRVEFLSDHNSREITINLEGEIAGVHTMVLDKKTSLKELLDIVNYSIIADKNGVQLYRKSIASLQKQLIESQLKDLESRVLSASSITTGGATIRKEESQMILEFVKRAKSIEPKGRILLNTESNLSNVTLEDGDTIYIPKQSSIVTIQGEVKIPGAQTFVNDYSIEEYIDSVGGFTDRADTEHILVIKINGKVITYDFNEFLKKDVIISKGDSILVLGKPNSESLQITKDITKILYQIAISTGVVVGLF